ncbi:DUF3054 domain-containing protein [Halonotius aquaticus]|uniref:DUF3054 domain-containing protein n=1 Tax=Halonotius aquaticus TaxID=2216978 RepID=A0A3A6PUP6_9EURY|nr:DUF3054 domain-containing protein [Halonotius aquaticus]RJX42041.1 DUF3054 domain-containing protein [Halonotius aquaticus]
MLNDRVDTAGLPLAVGDLLAILGVLTIGMVQHGSLFDQGGIDFAHAGGVYAPFVIGWLIGAVVIGAYSAGAGESAKAAIPLGLRAWVVAAFVGFALRATVFTGGLAPIFVAITLLLTGALIAGFRWLFFKIVG